ncbi:MAG: LysM peptidoglycan-binding domain-containing protein [Bacteroidia bacterium]|jgi:LysM repeat protein|nr:LysM peptidoglycan-binding domain-containing protein [Bacteroidia bacterium]
MNRWNRLIKSIALWLLTCHAIWATTPAQYIEEYKGCAIEQMLIYNIPASITLAQGMLESKCGNSPLAVYANNHFGIKCHDDWTGDYYVYDDDQKGEHFRKYQNPGESYHDHAEFLRSRPWYTFLFRYSRTDYKDWAIGLEKAGYATDKDYARQLLEIIRENHLYVYDTVLQNLNGYGILYNIKSTVPVTGLPGQKFVIVKPGDCIYKIAREYNVDASLVCRYNKLSYNDILMPGRKIYLTGSSELHSTRPHFDRINSVTGQTSERSIDRTGNDISSPFREPYLSKKAE